MQIQDAWYGCLPKFAVCTKNSIFIGIFRKAFKGLQSDENIVK